MKEQRISELKQMCAAPCADRMPVADAGFTAVLTDKGRGGPC